MATNPIAAEVAVLGAGPAGAATSIALLDSGISVALLYRRDNNRFTVGEHLSPTGRHQLSRLGAQTEIDPKVYVQSHGIKSHWGGKLLEKDYIYDPSGPAWNLDRSSFDDYLANTAIRKGALPFEVQNIKSIERSNKNWKVRFISGSQTKSLHTRFLVDATGRRATVARRLSLLPYAYDNLVALCGQIRINLAPSHSEDLRLLLEPMPDGWWYSVVAPGKLLTAVFLTDADIVPAGSRAATEFWSNRFCESEMTQLRAREIPSPQCFRITSARTQYSPKMAGDDWIMVGDACMAFDPLAAMGIAKAINDGIEAAEAINAALQNKCEPLCNYVMERKAKFARYLIERQNNYLLEQRWPNSVFWKRRHSPCTTTSRL